MEVRKELKQPKPELTLEELRHKIYAIKQQDLFQDSVIHNFKPDTITSTELQFWNEFESYFVELKNIFATAQAIDSELTSADFEDIRTRMTGVFQNILDTHQRLSEKPVKKSLVYKAVQPPSAFVSSDFIYGFRSFITYPGLVLSQKIPTPLFFQTFAEFLFPLYPDLSKKIPLN